MAERAPWWRAFLVKRKSGGSKDTAAPALDPDFNPFETKPKDPTTTATTATTAATATATTAATKTPEVDTSAPQAHAQPEEEEPQAQTNKGTTSLLSDETFDDSKMESVFNEQTCRRNMRVSRSGRFKEKRRVRSSLPIEEQEAGKEERR